MKISKRTVLKIVVMLTALMVVLLSVMPKEQHMVAEDMVVEVVEESTITLKVGELHSVRLVANPTTGFDWSCLNVPACCTVEIRYEPSTSPNQGAPGEAVVTVTGKAEGSGSLELGYQRSWEDAPPAETKHYFIQVVE